MANAYSAPNFNIDTSTNVAGLTSLKGSPCASTDKIYVYNGATLTVDAALAVYIIVIGNTSSGAASAGQKYGIVTWNAGITITFTGDTTATNSGIYCNPTTPGAESKNCRVNINGTSGSHCVATNSVGSLNTSNKFYPVYMYYGWPQITYFDVLYSWQDPVQFSANPTYNNATSITANNITCNNTFGTTGAYAYPIVILGTGITIPIDARFLIVNAVNVPTGYYVGFVIYTSTGQLLTTGGSIDISGSKILGGTSGQYFVPIYLGGGTVPVYTKEAIFSATDIRPTTLVPTGLALAVNGNDDHVLVATITNSGSYASTDQIVIYNNSGNAELARSTIAEYTTNSGIVVPKLTANTAYTMYAQATSDNNTFSASSSTATATTKVNPVYPTASQVLTTITFGPTATNYTGNVTEPSINDVRSTVQFGASGTQYTGNMTEPSANDVRNGTQYGTSGTQYTGNATFPAIAVVKNGTQYGTNGTQYTGTLVTPQQYIDHIVRTNTQIDIYGGGFGASQGAGVLTGDIAAWTVTLWSDSHITAHP